MEMVFEWNIEETRANLMKHGLSFEEAKAVFGDPLSLTFPDDYHSDSEDRDITVGRSERGKVLLVVHVDDWQPEDTQIVRIISCRRATPSERRIYGQGED